MTRALKLVLLFATIAVAGLMPSASAVGVAGVLFIPPFEAPEPTVISSMTGPCTINTTPVDAPDAQPAAGTFTFTAGLDVTNCANHAKDRIDDWTLGDIPALLAGMPATIVADFEITHADAGTTGSGDLEASIAVEIAGGRTQYLAREACTAGGGCSSLHKEGLVQLTEQVS